MSFKSYGNLSQSKLENPSDFFVEEIITNGYSVLENVIESDKCELFRNEIDRIYAIQEEVIGKENLNNINDSDVCRCPLFYNHELFLELVIQKRVISILNKLLGDYFILHLQNANINRPSSENTQSIWHKDLPYQNYVTSKPIAINALYAIDDFTLDNGGTQILPRSHVSESIPSEQFIEKHKVKLTLNAGDVLMFDSMLLHGASANTSNLVRRVVNNQYTVPIIKQQYDIGSYFKDFDFEPDVKRLLGVNSIIPKDDISWRQSRL